jgi:hypothetical protein
MTQETPLNPKPEPSDGIVRNNGIINHKGKKLKTVVSKLGLDMIPVIGGILIALFINNLQEDRRDNILLESTLESLAAEFEKNQKNVELYLPRQQRFLDTLRFYLNDKSLSISDIAEKAQRMGTPEIYSTNWRSSLSNNSLRLMNFTAVNLFSRIDSKHEEIKTQETFIYPMVYGPFWFKKGEGSWEHRKALEAWIVSLIGNERELIELYKEFEELISNRSYREKAN